MRLHFHEQGQGEPLVILHGLFGSLDNWTAIARRLSDRFRVFTIDQRNHGRSPHCAEMSYPLMAEDLRKFLAVQSVPDTHLLGHSMGGKTAMQLALLHPGLVRKLGVVDMAPRAYAPAHERLLNALATLDLASLQDRHEAATALKADVPDVSVRRFLLKNLARDSDGHLRWQFNLEGIRRSYAALNAALDAGRPYHGPALFIRGSRSDYVRDEDAPGILRLFPNAAFAAIPGAGHWVHADAPHIFADVAANFFGGESA